MIRARLGIAVAMIMGAMSAMLAAAAGSASTPRVVLPGAVVPEHYELTVTPDAAQLTFTGAVSITVRVLQPTRTITLNALELAVETATLDGRSALPHFAADERRQTLSFEFDQAIPAGPHVLALQYHGKINQVAMGLFALDYDSASGRQRALFTQFEVGDARRMLPCWDEPARKATFALTVLAPIGQMAVSNMPIAHTEDAAGGLQRVRFQPTPKMSTYLLFMAIGDFERVHRQVGGVDIGVVTRRGESAKGAYALDVAAELLPYYNDYFGTPYPLPKLDLLAGPGTSTFFSAMENWGAIFFFEKALLLDPRISTEKDRRTVYVDTAHEMAHQWFGDLVTMSWWEDLWLNEGFASWMEARSTDHFHPEWKSWSDSQQGTQAAMRLDAAVGTHPIVTPIVDAAQATEGFDAIAYQKGSAVIRMLEGHVGATAFRDGVRRYMRAHAYGNSVSDDLWRAIGGAKSSELTLMAHDFTLHAGVPLVRVQGLGCRQGRESLALSQGRFAIDESGKDGARRWHVPVALRSTGGGGAAHGVVISGSRPQHHAVAGCGPVVVNAGQTGYLRTQYLGAAYPALLDRYARLELIDQLGVLNDTAALATSGLVSLGEVMAIPARLPADADPLLWEAVLDQLLTLDHRYDGLATQQAFRAHARGLLQPVLARLGWEPVAGESGNAVILRRNVQWSLARFGDGAVQAEARRRFASYLQDRNSLAAAQRASTLEMIALNASQAEWNQIRSLAAAADSALEQQEYYRLLANARDPALAQQALDLALTTEAPATLRSMIMKTVAEEHPDLAVGFLIAHWPAIEPFVVVYSRLSLVANAARNGNDPRIVAVLEAYAVRFLPQGVNSSMRKSISELRFNVRVRARLPELDRWLAEHSSQAAANRPVAVGSAPG